MTDYEFYPTPHWCVRRILGALRLPFGGRWLEPCVGSGNIIHAVRDYYREIHCRDAPSWTTVDIRDGVYATYTGDFLRWVPLHKYEVCLMNPPFSRAIEFADKAITCCDNVIMLQRLDWLSTEGRCEWMRQHTPSVYVLPNRPSFAGGGTDGRDYAWFVFTGGPAELHILPDTPAAQRDKGDAPINDRQQELTL